MADYPHLDHAPAVEAAVEFRVGMAGPVPESAYATFRDGLVAQYPSAQNIRFVMPSVHIESATEIRTEVANSLVGIRLVTADRKVIVQAKSDGLTVSRLSPYGTWEELIGLVQDLWSRYVQVFKPVAVVRLGARYINRIPLGAEPVDLDTIMTAGPKVPAGLPQTVDQFLTRIVVPIERLGAMVSITQTMERTVAPSGALASSILMDIDAFREGEHAVDSPALWETLNRLREAKNMAFFESLHRSTWERFK